jgi:hypothetical protein
MTLNIAVANIIPMLYNFPMDIQKTNVFLELAIQNNLVFEREDELVISEHSIGDIEDFAEGVFEAGRQRGLSQERAMQSLSDASQEDERTCEMKRLREQNLILMQRISELEVKIYQKQRKAPGFIHGDISE